MWQQSYKKKKSPPALCLNVALKTHKYDWLHSSCDTRVHVQKQELSRNTAWTLQRRATGSELAALFFIISLTHICFKKYIFHNIAICHKTGLWLCCHLTHFYCLSSSVKAFLSISKDIVLKYYLGKSESQPYN